MSILPATERPSPFEASFVKRVCRVVPVKSFGMAEYSRGFLERDAMLSQIREGFCSVPGKHLLYIHKVGRGSQGLS